MFYSDAFLTELTLQVLIEGYLTSVFVHDLAQINRAKLCNPKSLSNASRKVLERITEGPWINPQ